MQQTSSISLDSSVSCPAWGMWLWWERVSQIPPQAAWASGTRALGKDLEPLGDVHSLVQSVRWPRRAFASSLLFSALVPACSEAGAGTVKVSYKYPSDGQTAG